MKFSGRTIIYSVSTGIAILLLLSWPVTYQEPITLGIDAYQYHGPLFGRHTQSQIIAPTQSLKALGALIVPLRRTTDTPDVQVTFTTTETKELLQTHTIKGSTIADDQFAYINLNPPLSSREPIEVTFMAPTASAANALGIRFHPDDVYPTGSRLFDHTAAPGDLALSLQRRLPLSVVFVKRVLSGTTNNRLLLLAACLSAVSAALAGQWGWIHRTQATRRWIQISLLGIIAVATIASRVPTLQDLSGVSGGDPYNYLFITDSITKLHNPFEGVKRLPGYPLLLLPAYLTALDDHTWMRLLNVVSAAGIVVLIPLLGMRLSLPWSVSLVATLMLAFQKDFYWISLRPEPYTLYAFLLLASLVVFFSRPSKKKAIVFGLLLGYAAMTRQEGFVLAAALGAAAIIHIGWSMIQAHTAAIPSPRKLIHHYTVAFAPALILVLPFFIYNTVTFGNPLYTPYFEGERLMIVDSWPAFQDAFLATWGVLGSLWKTSWDNLERVFLETPLFAVSALGGAIWWSYHRHRLSQQTSLESAIVIIASVLTIIMIISSYTHTVARFTSLFVIISAAILVVSPFALLTARPARGLLVAIVGLSQILIATWFHPFPKHYQQDLPLLALSVAALLIPTTTGLSSPRRIASTTAIFSVVFAYALAVMPLYNPDRLRAFIDEENQATALDSVVYRATTFTTDLPGPYGIDQAHLPARLYLQEDTHFYEEVENSSPTQEADWLARHNIKTLITTNSHSAFQILPPGWQLIKTFKAEGKNEQLFQSSVYHRQ